MHLNMIILAIISTTVALILIGILLIYRRQIKSICRQLAFLKTHKTNLNLTYDLPFSEINELINEINEIIDVYRKIQEDTQNNELHLKETITNLSHDIRTPLTSMDGYFQLMVESKSEEERKRYMEIINNRISSLKNMLEELFTYTKLQDTNYNLEIETVDFGKCIYDTLFSFYNEFKEKGIEPQTDFPNGHIFVQGNDEAIRRTIQNILKNALVHGNTTINLKLFKNENNIIFSCSNDVKNIDEIDIEQVFTRFYKADSSRTQTSTGLGLSIAKGFAERMGGTISAEIKENLFNIEFSLNIAAK